MSVGEKRGVWQALLDLIYPPKCPFCQKVLERGEAGLCRRCQRELPWIAESAAERTVEFCDGCFSPLWYRDGTVDGIHRYKFRDRALYADLFGTLMAQCVRDRMSEPAQLVTWVPLSKKRLRARGYDQARLLAERMAEELGIPAAPTLEKWQDNSVQSRIDDRDRRRANVRGVYRVLPDCPVNGKRVILVDDVTTSGATLSECAACLKGAGAAAVTAVTLARAGK